VLLGLKSDHPSDSMARIIAVEGWRKQGRKSILFCFQNTRAGRRLFAIDRRDLGGERPFTLSFAGKASGAAGLEVHLILTRRPSEPRISKTAGARRNLRRWPTRVSDGRHRKPAGQRVVPHRRHGDCALFSTQHVGNRRRTQFQSSDRAADVCLKERRRLVLMYARPRCTWAICAPW